MKRSLLLLGLALLLTVAGPALADQPAPVLDPAALCPDVQATPAPSAPPVDGEAPLLASTYECTTSYSCSSTKICPETGTPVRIATRTCCPVCEKPPLCPLAPCIIDSFEDGCC